MENAKKCFVYNIVNGISKKQRPFSFTGTLNGHWKPCGNCSC